MVIDKKVVKLRGIPYAVFVDRNDYDGRDVVRVRKCKRVSSGWPGQKWIIKTPDGEVDVTYEILRAEADQAAIEKSRREDERTF